MLHHVVLQAFTPTRCKRVDKPFDKITEQWHQHQHRHRHRQLRKLDRRPLVVSRTRVKHMEINPIIKDMITKGMATKAMSIKGIATKGIATKGMAIKIQDISKASILIGSPTRLF